MGQDYLHKSARKWPPLGLAEQRFLLACLQKEAPLPPVPTAFDWQTLTQRAVSDGLAPLLYRRLQAEPGVNAAALEQLKRSYYQNLSANHIRLTELRRLGQLLHPHGIRLLALKGAALAQTVYEDAALRFMGDLDVAVPAPQAEAALAELQAAGYTLHQEQVSAQPDRAAMQEFGWHLRLTKWVLGQQIELEFHWPLRQTVLVSQVAHLDLEHIWSTAVPLDPNANLWQPAPPAMLLHLCLHTGLQHRFSDLGLRHYLDIDRLLARCQHEPDFWPAFVRLAQTARAAQVSYYCLWLSQSLLGTKMPASILRQLAPPSWKHALFRRYFRQEDAINRTRALYGRRRLGWRFLTTDRPTDLLLAPWRVLFPGRPFLADYYNVHRPAHLLALTLWHPFHTLGRAARRRIRNLQNRTQPTSLPSQKA